MPRTELTTAAPELGKDGAIQFEVTLPVRQRRREAGQNGELGSLSKPISRPQIPRITRLMALAIKFQEMVDRGEVRDYADLARLGLVSRARITQIMNLLNLPPQLQDNMMLDPEQAAAISVSESQLRKITSLVLWRDQLDAWEQIGGVPRPKVNCRGARHGRNAPHGELGRVQKGTTKEL
jgi:hypothetical protein